MHDIYEDNETDTDGGLTTKDFQDLARHYIKLFFKNKVDECGCEIDTEELLTQRNVSLVLNLDVCEGMPLIYEAMKCQKDQKRKGKLPEDVELILKLLNECSRMSMPKPFAAGLCAIYIEVCKGCKLDL
jgi:hypothetical protein